MWILFGDINFLLYFLFLLLFSWWTAKKIYGLHRLTSHETLRCFRLIIFQFYFLGFCISFSILAISFCSRVKLWESKYRLSYFQNGKWNKRRRGVARERKSGIFHCHENISSHDSRWVCVYGRAFEIYWISFVGFFKLVRWDFACFKKFSLKIFTTLNFHKDFP